MKTILSIYNLVNQVLSQADEKWTIYLPEDGKFKDIKLENKFSLSFSGDILIFNQNKTSTEIKITLKKDQIKDENKGKTDEEKINLLKSSEFKVEKIECIMSNSKPLEDQYSDKLPYLLVNGDKDNKNLNALIGRGPIFWAKNNKGKTILISIAVLLVFGLLVWGLCLREKDY